MKNQYVIRVKRLSAYFKEINMLGMREYCTIKQTAKKFSTRKEAKDAIINYGMGTSATVETV